MKYYKSMIVANANYNDDTDEEEMNIQIIEITNGDEVEYIVREENDVDSWAIDEIELYDVYMALLELGQEKCPDTFEMLCDFCDVSDFFEYN